jgi:NitT/TauT family transport system substrate-binding protein
MRPTLWKPALRTALLLAAVALLTGRGSAAGPAQLRIALIPGDAAGQVFYAQELGLFAKAGLDVQIMNLNNGGAIAAAVVGGSADVGVSNVVSLAVAHERGLPFTILAPGGLALSAAPTNGILAVPVSSPVRSAKDLNGKMIAVDALGSLPNLAGKAWIDANGGDSKTVKYVELGFPEMENAVIAGRVDAVSINLTVDATVNKPGDPLRTLGIVYDAISPRFASAVWFTTTTWTTEHPDTIKAFMNVMRQTAVWGNAHHHESALILAKYTKQTPEQIEGGTRVAYAPDNEAALYQPLIDLSAKYGALKATFPARDIMAAPVR